VGNVWEWCGSPYDPSDIENPNASRVMRGGSWAFDRDFARSAGRFWGSPFDRRYYFGFRALCSSPILEQ
jgi:formylglycine-generating enzyme required for sulfatase activity